MISLCNPNLYFVGRQQPAEMPSLALIAILHLHFTYIQINHCPLSSLRNSTKPIPATECLLKLFSPSTLLFFVVALFENTFANIFQVGTKAETAG